MGVGGCSDLTLQRNIVKVAGLIKRMTAAAVAAAAEAVTAAAATTTSAAKGASATALQQ